MVTRARTRLKTLLFTLGVLTIAMYTVINVLASEFSIEESRRISYFSSKFERPDEDLGYKEYFVLKVQRKPKTTNLEDTPYKLRSKKLLKTSMDTANKMDNLLIKQRYDQGNINNLNNGEDNEILMKTVSQNDPAQDGNGYDDDDYAEDEEYEDEDIENDDDDENIRDYKLATNPPFKPGDFGDITGLEYKAKPNLQYERVNNKVDNVKKTKMVKTTPKAIDLTDNEIYWSSYVEALIPKGLPYLKMARQLQQWRGNVVQTLEKPGWNKCGRPQNGFVVLNDGTKMCARYREPHNSFVYGESLSFFLSQLLNMDNVPATVLSVANSTKGPWKGVNISSLAWKENRLVALIQWIEDLNNGERSKAYIPPLILQAYRKGQPITRSIINNTSLLKKNPAQVAEIVQWGTMIVFDYLTGNYDRVASMQDAEDKENNPHIMEESIRNLHKSSSDGKLWLIDNESGLLDAYDLLSPQEQNSRFETFHNKMLRTMCVFQMSLVKALRKLYKYPRPHQRLLHYAQSLEPLLANISTVKSYDLFVKMFDTRLKNVIQWITHCQEIQTR